MKFQILPNNTKRKLLIKKIAICVPHKYKMIGQEHSAFPTVMRESSLMVGMRESLDLKEFLKLR